jgi:hypothetical protein
MHTAGVLIVDEDHCPWLHQHLLSSHLLPHHRSFCGFLRIVTEALCAEEFCRASRTKENCERGSIGEKHLGKMDNAFRPDVDNVLN